MLSKPGQARKSLSSTPSQRRRKAAEENLDDVVRRLQRLPPNKACADCTSKLTQSVNLTHGTFVCMPCSGVHREFNHKIKGIGHSSFTADEVAKLRHPSSGNEAVNARFLARHGPSERIKPPRNNSDLQHLREWIRQKYVEKRWCEDEGRGGGGQERRSSSSSTKSPSKSKPKGESQRRKIMPAPKQKSSSQPPPPPEAPSDPFGFDSIAPSSAAANDSSWDAFGGGQAPPTTAAPAFQADFGSPPQQPQPTMVSLPPAGQPAAMSQQPSQQQPPQQAFQADFNHASAAQPPQPPDQTTMQQPHNQMQGGGFANFSTIAPAQQMQTQGGNNARMNNQLDGFANFSSVQQPEQQHQNQRQQMTQQFPGQAQMGQMGQPAQYNMQAKGTGIASQQQGANFGQFPQEPPQIQMQPQPQMQQQINGSSNPSGFANFSSMQPQQPNQGQQQMQMQQQGSKVSNDQAGFVNFPSTQQPQNQPPQQPQMPPQNFASFSSMQPTEPLPLKQLPMQQQKQVQPLSSAPSQMQGVGAMNLQQGSQPMVSQPEAMGGGHQEQSTSSMQPGSSQSDIHPQSGTMLPQNGVSTSDGDPATAVKVQPRDSEESTVSKEADPSSAPGQLPNESEQPRPSSSMNPNAFRSLDEGKKSAFDAFDGLSLEPTPASHGESSGPSDAGAPLAAPKAPAPAPYCEGQDVIYRSSSGLFLATVAKVHYDDELRPYYTITVDGREKQTDNTHLCLPGSSMQQSAMAGSNASPNPADTSALLQNTMSMLQNLNSQQLVQVQQFIGTLIAAPSAGQNTQLSAGTTSFGRVDSGSYLGNNLPTAPKGGVPHPSATVQGPVARMDDNGLLVSEKAMLPPLTAHPPASAQMSMHPGPHQGAQSLSMQPHHAPAPTQFATNGPMQHPSVVSGQGMPTGMPPPPPPPAAHTPSQMSMNAGTPQQQTMSMGMTNTPSAPPAAAATVPSTTPLPPVEKEGNPFDFY